MGEGIQVRYCIYLLIFSHFDNPKYFFSQFDLYTKSTKIPDVEALKPYYQGLIDKYLPGTIKF